MQNISSPRLQFGKVHVLSQSDRANLEHLVERDNSTNYEIPAYPFQQQGYGFARTGDNGFLEVDPIFLPLSDGRVVGVTNTDTDDATQANREINDILNSGLKSSERETALQNLARRIMNGAEAENRLNVVL